MAVGSRVCLALAVLCALSSCHSANRAAGNATPTMAAKPPDLGAFPVGYYSRKVTNLSSPSDNGTYGVEFDRSGRLRVYFGTRLGVNGTFSIRGAQIIIRQADCTDGLYRWALSGAAITFAPLQPDACEGGRRQGVLAGGSWAKSG